MGQFGFPPGINPGGPGMTPYGGMQEQQMDPMAQYYGQQQNFQMLNPNAPELRHRSIKHAIKWIEPIPC